MRSICDFHIHSKYSRGCSGQLSLENIAIWCAKKGIDVVSVSDFTYPDWIREIREKLVEDGPGIFKLKNNNSKTRFILSTEISQIYKKNDKCRRIHNLIFSPSIDAVDKIIKELESRECNLKSDGRPIIGVDSEDLVEIIKTVDGGCELIPAHAWTPWFSVFGSKSGFDTLEECFGKMTKHIFAVETGLSSDPLMNWRLSALDDITLISNSDAHSLPNLGREANVFEVDKPDYFEYMRIMKEQDKKKFLYTIEFYPEEGKYHADGCRNCKFHCLPEESKKHGGRCPKCKKPITIGVLSRVDELADRKVKSKPKDKIPYKSIIPLDVLISEVRSVGPKSKKVQTEYEEVIAKGGNEFAVLLDRTYDELNNIADQPIIEAIRRMREGNLSIRPGYDGEFGKVKVFEDENDIPVKKQKSLI